MTAPHADRTALDLRAIEAEAHRLRAEALREIFAALSRRVAAAFRPAAPRAA